MNNKHVIYGLIDPRNSELKYVGLTSDIKTRLMAHLKPSSLKKNTYKNNWIKSLQKENLRPEVLILERYENANDLSQAEIELIEYYKFIGCNLTNGDSGGIGGKGRKHSEEENKAKSERQKGKIFSEEYKLKISNSKIGHSVSDETKQKISKANKGKTWKLIDGKRIWCDK